MPVCIVEKPQQHIMWIKINRPDARNALDFEVMDELERLTDKVQKDNAIRVLILSGTGNESFISGGDLKKFHSIKDQKTAAEMSRRMQQILIKVEELPCWTVAYINGDAYGGGVETMLAFDFRLAKSSARFGFTQGRFNLVPGWGGLTRIVEKAGRAKALQWLGRTEIIDAGEAFKYNLIEMILHSNEPEEELLLWCERLTRNDRRFIRSLKEGAFRAAQDRKMALEAEIEPFSKLWADMEHEVRVERFLNRMKTD